MEEQTFSDYLRAIKGSQPFTRQGIYRAAMLWLEKTDPPRQFFHPEEAQKIDCDRLLVCSRNSTHNGFIRNGKGHRRCSYRQLVPRGDLTETYIDDLSGLRSNKYDPVGDEPVVDACLAFPKQVTIETLGTRLTEEERSSPETIANYVKALSALNQL
ncbi:MAG: hypothetical protein KKA90_00145 [Nanoarchaeota archaeon]|nr:hypothetical protein [Nanoarchaeota archaeon]